MFSDRAVIYIKSGSGGDGAVAFHREKFVAAGGPDGGDGGKGGSVIFTVDDAMSTLADFRFKRKYVAENGEKGGTNKKTGKTGSDIVIKVPKGTILKDNKTGKIIADLCHNDDNVTVLKGGRGGLGNFHFATATRQIPNFAKSGYPGKDMEVLMELKLLADAGLVGFPNVGKSSLLSVTTAAKPEIANYHFTTLNPHLGVVYEDEGNSFVLADIPGLIEGASSGAGLGFQFLRHIERTRLMIHVLDMSGSEGRDPFDDFIKINAELKQYNPRLAKRPQLIAANKMDIYGADENLVAFKEKFNTWLDENHEEIADTLEIGAWKIFEISAATSDGTRELMAYTGSLLKKLPMSSSFDTDENDEVIYDAETIENNGPLFTVSRDEDGVYVIEGDWITRTFAAVNLNDYESANYFQRVLRQKGVIDELEKLGVQDEDIVRIGDTEFEFYY